MLLILLFIAQVIFIVAFFLYKNSVNKHINSLNDIINSKNKKIELLVKQSEDNTIKSNFLANISHEIRTPLNAIIGFSELLFLKSSNSKERDYIEAINTSGLSLLTLVNDILDLSKIEAGMFQVQFEPVNIFTIIKDIKTVFKPKFLENDIEFKVIISDDFPRNIILNEIRLKQILTNLLSNSFKFTEKGFVNLHFFHENIEDSFINFTIIIEDSGIGISKNEISEVFKSFKQQKNQNSSKYGGTGLGLTITKEITTALKGFISLESQVGKGSSFTVNFPHVEISKDILSEVKNVPQNIKFKNSPIIIADDNKLNRRVLNFLLSDMNFTVIEAKNGKELLEIVDSVEPVFIITDIKMPVLDGIDATRILKLDEKTGEIPIFALTAYSETSLVSDAEKEYFDAFLTKPLSRDTLINLISRYVKYADKD